MGAKYCDLCGCTSVFLSVRPHISKRHVQIARHFPHMLPVAVARSCSDDIAMCYILPVSWMTSRFHITEPMDQNCMFRRVRQVAAAGAKLPLTTARCYFVISVKSYRRSQQTVRRRTHGPRPPFSHLPPLCVPAQPLSHPLLKHRHGRKIISSVYLIYKTVTRRYNTVQDNTINVLVPRHT